LFGGHTRATPPLTRRLDYPAHWLIQVCFFDRDVVWNRYHVGARIFVFTPPPPGHGGTFPDSIRFFHGSVFSRTPTFLPSKPARVEQTGLKGRGWNVGLGPAGCGRRYSVELRGAGAFATWGRWCLIAALGIAFRGFTAADYVNELSEKRTCGLIYQFRRRKGFLGRGEYPEQSFRARPIF